jgi:peroxiredoxin
MFDFTLPDVDGRTVRLSDYNDQKGVVVVFTCNHCPYAIAYELRLIALHQRFAPLGVPVVAISANDAVKYPQDGPDHMRTRATQRGFPYVYLYDQSQSVARAYKAERTPEVFLLRNMGNGDWRQVYAGAIDDNHLDARAAQQHYLADAITQLLENQGIERPQTQAVGCSIKWA